MTKMLIGASLLCWSMFASVTFAQTTLVIPEMKSDQEKFIKNDLTTATLVKTAYFSFQVPKGWTISSVGPGENFKSNATATPTSDAVNDPTHIGFHVTSKPPKENIEQFYETKWKPKLKPGDKQSFVIWQGQRWLLWEHSCQNVTNEDARCWAAKAIANGQGIVMIASTPTRLASKYELQLKAIMQSIAIQNLRKPVMFDAGFPSFVRMMLSALVLSS